MRSKFLLMILSVGLMVSAHAQQGTGLVENPSQKGTFKFKIPEKRGYAGELPSSYSLMMYTPYVKSQGQYGTCAAWSAAYSAYTTTYAMSLGMTDRNLITALSFCPYFVYNEVNGDNACNNGTSLESILLFMVNTGVKRFYMPLIGCGTPITAAMEEDAANHKIIDAYILYDAPGYPDESTAAAVSNFLLTKPKPDIQAVKTAVANGTPVVFGGYVANSFMNAMGVSFWEPGADEKADPGQAVMDNHGMHQQHAMCIIGYDDNKYGGAFLIMNSWSQLWGDNGYIWVKYDDWGLFNYKAFWLDIGTVTDELLVSEGCASGDCNNGYGVQKYAGGERYEGHFTNGLRNGYGIYTWPAGTAYAGEWKSGKRDGEAVIYQANGNYGTCVYKDDVQTGGFGEWTYTNGDRYTGSLSSDYIRNGYGIYSFTDGRVYSGAQQEDKFSGLGSMQWTNGDQYYGEWTDNEMNGYGIYQYANGKIKAGIWSYGVMLSGQNYGYAKGNAVTQGVTGGLFTALNYASADCTSGDCLNGMGSKKYSSGLTYEGEFKDALEDGYGSWIFTDGSKQTGYFVQGRPNGVFKVTYQDGGIMIGDCVKGKINGYGMYIMPDASVVVEYFENGEFIREVAPSSETMNTQVAPEKFGMHPTTDMHIQSSK